MLITPVFTPEFRRVRPDFNMLRTPGDMGRTPPFEGVLVPINDPFSASRQFSARIIFDSARKNQRRKLDADQ